MRREDLIRDFLNTVLIPGSKDSLLKYALAPLETDNHLQLIFEVPSPLLTTIQPLIPYVEEWLKKTFQNHQVSCGLTSQRNPTPKTKVILQKIKHIICIASGKGGVGKSTIALNLALIFHQLGKRVGILDADIYGPSLPQMLDIHEKPTLTGNKKLVPLTQYGIQVLSIGFMVPPDSPIIWRGPMVQGALMQLLKEADWDVDILVIDTPPGTGDVHLTLAQQVSLSGVIIVSTPQDVALIDVKRSMSMFERLKVPILGIIENMSFFECPHCHHESHIFSHAGARQIAKSLGIAFIGEIPLDIKTRLASDTGKPIPVFEPEHKISKLYQKIAINILETLPDVC